MISVGEDTFFCVIGMHGEVLIEVKPSKVIFKHYEKVVAEYDRMKNKYTVESEELRRLTGSWRADSH